MTGLVKGLSALWQTWLVEGLKLVTGNPWKGIERPRPDRRPVKYATDELVEHLYAWLAERFCNWPFRKLFLSVKAYTGCRLIDLCSLTSTQLEAGRLVFPPDVTKGRNERRVPLAVDLFAAPTA